MCIRDSHFPGPTWQKPGADSVLLASRRYDESTSRKTKGSMADTLQGNLWRRAQTPHRMTHHLHHLLGHHSCFDEQSQASALQAQKVQRGRASRHGQQAVLHQLVGHVLAHRPPQEAPGPDGLRRAGAAAGRDRLAPVCEPHLSVKGQRGTPGVQVSFQ